jgi:hypothetical protein
VTLFSALQIAAVPKRKTATSALRNRRFEAFVATSIVFALLSAGASANNRDLGCVRARFNLAGVGASSSLNGVAAVAPNDVWSVGVQGTGAGRPLIEHYKDGRWQQTGAGPLTRGVLFDVLAISSDDVWAIGDTDPVGFGAAVVIHWNGKHWSRVPVPLPKVYALQALSAAGRSIWVLAYDQHGTVTLRRTAHRWQVIRASPSRGYDIAIVSPRDGWIVGDAYDTHGVDHSFVRRWNGRKWTTVRVPSTVRGHLSEHEGEILWSVAAAKANDVWAVGYADSSGFTGFYDLRWNGARWRLARNPGGKAFRNAINSYTGAEVSIAVSHGGEAWLVAGGDAAGHYNGRNWASIPDPARGVDLHAVSTSSAGTAWAVGDRGASGDNPIPVVERLDCQT